MTRPAVASRAADRSGRRLLAPGALRAAVQPIVRLADREIVGYEAHPSITAPIAV